MSVLTHVVLNSSLSSELVATKSLAYILNAERDIARAFIEIFRDAGIEFEPAKIQPELSDEDSRPDLTIHDNHGCIRAFVENKFWAGLTEAQPVSYLRNLPENIPSALLFIVPQPRVPTVWSELKLRCHQAELEWENGRGTPNITWSRVGCKILLITSWTHVLERLLNAAQSRGHDSLRHDILQLQDLTSRMDSEAAFLPIRSDEITDQETARRLINYSDLIDDITKKLTDNQLLDAKVSNYGRERYSNGRYLVVHKRFGLWLGINFQVWHKAGVTPLWWRFYDDEYSGVAGGFQKIQELFADVHYDEDSGFLYIPVRLKAGVERDTVVEDAIAQMTRISDVLLENFRDNC